jgi:hypothetical protein
MYIKLVLLDLVIYEEPNWLFLLKINNLVPTPLFFVSDG